MFVVFSFILSVIISWKLLRIFFDVQTVFLWDLHVYFLLALAIFSVTQISFLQKISVSQILIYFLILILTVGIFTRVYGHSMPEYVFITNYLFPVFAFFYGRQLILKKNEYDVEKFFLIIFSIIIFLNILDYLSANNLIGQIFDKEKVYFFADKLGREYESTFGNADLPIFNIVVNRPQGVSFSPFGSATLTLAISFYFFYNSKNFKILGNLLFFISLILAFFYAVGTVYLVFAIALLLGIRGILIKMIYLPIFFFISISIIYFKRVQELLLYVGNMIESIYQHSMYLMPLIFVGGGYHAYDLITGEIYLISLFFIIGLIAYLILIALLFIAFIDYSKKLSSENTNSIQNNYNYFIPLSIFFVSCIHYNSLFIYPNALIFFFLLGCIDAKRVKNSQYE